MEVLAFEIDGETQTHTPNYSRGCTCESQKANKEFTDTTQNAVLVTVKTDDLPSYILRGAWKLSGSKVGVDITKGKTVAHEHRRAKREEALKSNTAILTKNSAGIPLAANENAATAASENSSYMLTDDACQIAIDESTTAPQLLSALKAIGIE